MRIFLILSMIVASTMALTPNTAWSQDEDDLDAMLEGLNETIGADKSDEAIADMPAVDADTAAEEILEEIPEAPAADRLEDLVVSDQESPAPPMDEETLTDVDAVLNATPRFDQEDNTGALEEVGAKDEEGAVDIASRARAMDDREIVKRRLAEIEGFKALDEGYKSLSDEDWLNALDRFEKALIKLPVRSANQEYIERAKWGAAEANYKLAEIALEETPQGAPLDSVKEFIAKAKSYVPDHADIGKLERQVAKREKPGAGPERARHVKDTPTYQKRDMEIARLLQEGKQLYEVNDLDKAEDAFEGVIFLDRYNRDALRFLRRVANARYAAASQELAFTEDKMVAQVRDAWNPPLGEQAIRREELAQQVPTTTLTETEVIEEQMAKIIIQELNFRQANIIDVVNFLVDTSRQQDPTGRGINIILNLQSGAVPVEEKVSEDNFGGGLGDISDFDLGEFDVPLDTGTPKPAAESSRGSGFAGVPAVTLNLRRVSLLDSLKFVTDITRLKYRVENGVVVIKPVGVVDNPITRFYPVDSTLFSDFTTAAGGMGGGGGGGAGEFEEFGAELDVGGPPDVKEMFKGYGVPFPNGTSITYSPTLSQITVVNTPENIEKFERVLSKINVIPRQIEIEAKFVEILQDDLDELGLEWIFTDDWEIATRTGPGPIAARERLVVNQTPFGVTKGNRFFGQGSTDIIPSSVAGLPSVGNILSVAGVLTNPELQVVLHAIDQAGSANLLSAPRVTTLNGVNAQIEVVEEIIYPTEFEFDDRDVTTVAGGVGATGPTIVPPAVIPGSFETREVGVILNVTPQVNADNYTINLTLVPEIAELVDWLQYGASFPVGNGESFLINIPQPLFASRNITTSIVVWDGHTVVMGGLIREDVVKFEDKIPILGDIPLLGRLFTSRGEKSTKRNLVIFVTARLVDPAGNPINARDDVLDTAAAGVVR